MSGTSGEVSFCVRGSQIYNGSMLECVVLGELQRLQGRVNPDYGGRTRKPCCAKEQGDTAGPRAEIEHVNGLLRRGCDSVRKAQSPVFGFRTWN